MKKLGTKFPAFHVLERFKENTKTDASTRALEKRAEVYVAVQ